MEKLFAGTPHTKFIAAASAVILTIAIATSARGVQLQAGRVTQVVNDVKLSAKEAPRPVALGDLIRHGAPVSTGTQSRGELTFNDLTITRLGANTTFSFKPGTREMNLIDGAILFQVPKGSGGATIRTVGVTAAITGTTGIGEFHPATARNPHLFSKWLCLEGTFHLYLANGQSVELGPGEMVTTDGISFSTVLTFDIARLVSTSLFFTGYDRPLPSLDLIVLESQKQLASMLFAPTTSNPLDPARIVNVISQAIVAEEAQTSPSESPTPSEFGPPSVITSPVPYLITNGTVITTDPSITTNGVTDFGKIYRGPVDDGAFSLWAFGSTSAVDTALDFDTNFENAGHFPLAAFKFTSLVLAGNPTIDLTNGVTNLALISVGDITSGLPGGTLTFSGLDALLLASQDSSINLGSEITFQGIPTLFFYARGTNGDLTLASPILGTTDLFLYAGRNITFNAGTDLILGGQFSTRSAGGNISVSESGNIAIGGSLAATSDVIADAPSGGNITFATGGSFSASDVVVETSVEPGVTLTDGANISFDIGTSLTVNGGSLSLTVNDSNGGTIGTGGNITLNTGANLTINGGGALTLDVLNNNGGHIGTGGNISVTTGGDLTAGSIDALIDNSGGTIGGGTIGGSANLMFNLGGQLATQSDTSFTINNSNGGMIGVDAGMNVSATSISTVGSLFANILNFASGNIVGGADLSLNLTGDLTTQGDALLTISNDTGGTIGSDAVINVTAANISTGGALNAAIVNSSGGGSGNIVGTANINLNLTGDLTAGDAALLILNDPGGTIGSDAVINLTANNVSTGTLNAAIDNSSSGGSGGGNIVGTANINLNLTGDLTAGDAALLILNDPGGTIGSDAVINVTANNVSTGTLNAAIDNSRGGSGGGNIVGIANINFNLPGDLTTAGDASLFILNDTGGTIGSDAVINVTANNVSTGTLNAAIDNSRGGSGGGDIVATANINLNLTGDLTTQGDALLTILNDTGTIGSHATINVTANNVSTGILNAAIDNSSGGTIGGVANLIFDLTGDLTTTSGDASFRIDNANRNGISGGSINGDAIIAIGVGGDISAQGTGLFEISNDDAGSSNGGGTIFSNAIINVNAANISTGGPLSATIDNFDGGGIGGGTIGGNATINLTAANITANSLLAQIDNSNGGSIGSSANVTLNVGGNLTTQGDAAFQIHNRSGGGVATIGSNATVNVTANNVSTGGLSAAIDNSSGGGIGGDAAINFTANTLSVGTLSSSIENSQGSINGSANINFNLTGDLTTQGDAGITISSAFDGTIGSNATVNITANNISTGGNLSASIINRFTNIGLDAAMNVSAASISTGTLNAAIDNSGGTIGGSANGNFNLTGDLTTGGDATFQIDNSSGTGGATIGSNATLNVTANNISTGGNLFADILNSFGGTIGGIATVNVTANNVSTGGNLGFTIEDSFSGSNIGGNATINVTAANIVANSLLAQINNAVGGIGGNAAINFNLTGDLTTVGDATLSISGVSTGSDALNITANNISTGGNLSASIINPSFTNIGLDDAMNVSAASISTGTLNAAIDKSGSTIGGSANLTFNIGGALTAQGDAVFAIDNSNGGTGGDAVINVTANNVSTGTLNAAIDNIGGTIAGNANLTFNIGAALTTSGDAVFTIDNSNVGTGGDATINVSAGSIIAANSLLAQIDNTFGSIGGNAAINMNVSGSATATNDATVAIFGNDPAGSAAINFNGGSYDVGGTFVSQIGANNGIGGNGTITFFNASAHADVLKAGVFGTNGVLNIGGGMLSANTMLKLYAPGSNGQLNFVSDVTLGGNSATILAANSVTISNGAVVTIGGSNPADVFTNHANYSGNGGNFSTTGTFGGVEANDPLPLADAPPFGSNNVTSSGKGHRGGKAIGTTINISSSDQLLSMLDGAVAGPGGKITIPPSKSAINSRNSNRNNVADRLNARSRLNPDRREMDRRTASSSVMRRLQ